MVKKKLLGFNMIFVAFALAISLVAFASITNSRAWFASNQEVDAFGMSVSSYSPAKITASVKSYGVIDISQEDTVFHLEAKDGEGNRPESYSLPLIDPNNISYSQYKKALVLVLEVVATDNISVDITLNTPNDTTILNSADNHFSNCMKISDATFDDAKGQAQKLSNTSKAFVSVSNDTCSKVTSITLANEVALQKDVPTYLYYVIEYNNDFIDHVNNYILKNHLFDILEISYQNDITFFVAQSSS